MKTLALLATAAAIALPAAAQAQSLDYTLPSNFGSQNVTAGFLPDPIAVSIAAGGSVNAGQIGGCAGYVSQNPDYEINYSAGGYALTFYVESGADTTLVINAPDARYYCNDDTNGLNPQVRFANPQSGVYDIWVGTYSSSAGFPQSTLYITELR